MLYLNKNYYFDNLRSIDWQKCLALLDVYQQESLSRSLRNLSQNKNASLDKA